MTTLRAPLTLYLGLLAVCAVAASGTRAQGETPGEAQNWTGAADSYQTPLKFQTGPSLWTPYARVAGRVESVSLFPTDAKGATYDEGVGGDVLARVGLTFNSVGALAPSFFIVDFEMDAWSGRVGQAPKDTTDGMPTAAKGDSFVLREAKLTFLHDRSTFGFTGGFTTSHWGLGMVSNDGNQFWAPTSADFLDSRGGDRVLRGALFLKTKGVDWFQAAVAFDAVQSDDFMLDGDKAWQGTVALKMHQGFSDIGLYLVGRQQNDTSGRDATAWVVDLYGETDIPLGGGTKIHLATEWAVILGKTSLAPSPNNPEHDLMRVGGVVQTGIDWGRVGTKFDFIFASGDQNFDDGVQSAFFMDPNFNEGLYFYRHVMAANSARSVVNASDLTLMGEVPLDLDRFPTRGRISNTVAFFPRGFFRITHGLELYGGALFAFAASPPADPLNTRVNGGQPTNTLNNTSGGNYYGTELDLGLKYRAVIAGSELTLGAEGGVFIPGGAVQGGGITFDNVWGGRFTLNYRL